VARKRRSPIRRIRRRNNPVRRRRTTRRATGKTRRNGGMMSRSWGKISTAIGGLAFLQQVSGEDMHNAQNLPIGDKAKVLLNSLTGRIFGIGVVPGLNAPPQTLNFSGIFNKWSGLGAGLWLLAKQPINIPHKGKADRLGRSLLTAGVLGGIFSPGNLETASQHTHVSALQNFAYAGGSTQ